MHGQVGYSSRKISFFVFVIGITDADTPEVMKSTLGTVIYARDITKTAISTVNGCNGAEGTSAGQRYPGIAEFRPSGLVKTGRDIRIAKLLAPKPPFEFVQPQPTDCLTVVSPLSGFVRRSEVFGYLQPLP